MTRIGYLDTWSIYLPESPLMKSLSKKQPALDRRQFHRRTVLGTASLVAAANLGFAAPKKASRYVDMQGSRG